MRIPSRFARLLYLTRCCNDGGMYRHYGLELVHAAAEVHRTLRQAHLDEWNRWQSEFTMEQQFLDLLDFLCEVDARLVVHSWELTGDPWDVVVPRAASLAERDLFRVNFRALLTLLKAHFPANT